MNFVKPKKCPKCGKKIKKATGEGYDTLAQKNIPFTLGRICDRCEIIYLNPIFIEYKIIKDSDVGQ